MVILDQEQNNFAILNNGITILSDNVDITESTGRKNEGQLILTTPQILNGGQTAYTLSTIYEEFRSLPDSPLEGKEVLLKIITPVSDSNTINTDFIESISIATNQQNEVSEADRRSNHEVQIELQRKIYNDYGYFYERKSGEFHDGIGDGIIDKSYIVNRLALIKAYKAYLGEPAAARRTSETILFREDAFNRVLGNIDNYREMFFSYLLFNKLENIEATFSNKIDTVEKFGYSLLYGKWAVVASIGIMKPTIKTKYNDIFQQASERIEHRLLSWTKFDEFIRKKRSNTKYFQEGKYRFELFYKVNLLDEDVKEFFLK